MHELEIRATRAEERARELETVATLAREETLKAKEETEKAKKDAQLALKQAEQTMMEKKGEQLLNVALRYKELNDSTYDQVIFHATIVIINWNICNIKIGY